MKKKFLALAMAGVMAFGMTACGSGEEADSGTGQSSGGEVSGSSEKQNVSLTLWGAEEDQTLLRSMADKFIEDNKDQANITIEIGVQSESTAKDTILTDVEAAADVYSFADDQLNELVKAGALQEITEELGRSDIESRNVQGSVDAATLDGKLYAYPRTADNGYFLFYNKEYLSDEDVKTFDGILAAAQAAGKQVTMDYSSGWYLYSFFAGAGLTATLADDGVTTVCDWNSTSNAITGAQVAQAMLDIAQSSAFVSLTDAEFVTGIQEGSIIAGINGTWNAKAAEEAWGENYGATVLPTYTVNGQQIQMGSFAGYKLVGVNPHSEYVVWAMKLADYITNEENQTISFEQRGNGPSNINAAASDAVKADLAISAQSMQSQYADVQRVGAKFWDATSTFGMILAQGNPEGTDLQTLLDNMVEGITAPVE